MIANIRAHIVPIVSSKISHQAYLSHGLFQRIGHGFLTPASTVEPLTLAALIHVRVHCNNQEHKAGKCVGASQHLIDVRLLEYYLFTKAATSTNQNHIHECYGWSAIGNTPM